MSLSLQNCVHSLRDTLGRLDDSIKTLDAGVSDLPRLSRVLQTTRHFELLPEPALLQAQSSLLSEIQPEVTNLLSRVETHLDKLDRREQGLMAKCELQEGRLLAANERGSSTNKRTTKPALSSAGIVSAAKMQQVIQKKERLSYAIERLQLQAGQKERQLRKSLAVLAPPPPEDEDLDF